MSLAEAAAWTWHAGADEDAARAARAAAKRRVHTANPGKHNCRVAGQFLGLHGVSIMCTRATGALMGCCCPDCTLSLCNSRCTCCCNTATQPRAAQLDLAAAQHVADDPQVRGAPNCLRALPHPMPCLRARWRLSWRECQGRAPRHDPPATAAPRRRAPAAAASSTSCPRWPAGATLFGSC
jgi:hypothetical protein